MLVILHISPKHFFLKTGTTMFATSESSGNDSYTNEKLHILLAAQLVCFSAVFFPPRLLEYMPSGLICYLKRCLVTTEEDFKDTHTFEKIQIML